MILKRPTKWKIEIWEDDGKWHESYIELFPDTEEVRKAIETSVDLIRIALLGSGFITCEIKEAKMEGLIGISITLTAHSLAAITNQLLSEFVLMSEIGDITLRDLFVVLIQNFISQSAGKEDDTKKIV